MKKSTKIIKDLLLIFVFVSIGYVLGKHSLIKDTNSGNPTTEETEKFQENSEVFVYYMHATFRCASCNNIEKMTKQLLYSRFKRELNRGSIKFLEVNFQENEKLAKRFDIISSCVVVARVEGGKTMDFKRLDKVWTLMNDRTKFDAYLSNAILDYLPGKLKGKGSPP